MLVSELKTMGIRNSSQLRIYANPINVKIIDICHKHIYKCKSTQQQQQKMETEWNGNENIICGRFRHNFTQYQSQWQHTQHRHGVCEGKTNRELNEYEQQQKKSCQNASI